MYINVRCAGSGTSGIGTMKNKNNMTEKEYNNLQKGDVIFDMKAKDAYVVGKVEDGHVEWEKGGSMPRARDDFYGESTWTCDKQMEGYC